MCRVPAPPPPRNHAAEIENFGDSAWNSSISLKPSGPRMAPICRTLTRPMKLILEFLGRFSLEKRSQRSSVFLPCLGGGTGRRAGLKIQCPQGRASSSLARGTIFRAVWTDRRDSYLSRELAESRRRHAEYLQKCGSQALSALLTSPPLESNPLLVACEDFEKLKRNRDSMESAGTCSGYALNRARIPLVRRAVGLDL
jgi:hypothetical protein